MSSLLKISVSFIIIFLQLNASGGIPNGIPAGARDAGMGSVCLMKNDFWASFRNQALLAFNKNYAFGVNYENRFGISELGTRTAAALIPAGKTSIGAAYSGFGYREYRRDAAGLACGLKIGEKIAAGIQADYFSVRTSGEYNNKNYLSFEAGVIMLPAENITIGIHVFNPLPNSLRREYMPMTLTAGAGIYLSKGLFAGAEIFMISGKRLEVKAGCEFETCKNLWLRAGFRSENNSFCFGMGYMAGFARIDLGFATHERLGVTTSVSLIFRIRQ